MDTHITNSEVFFTEDSIWKQFVVWRRELEYSGFFPGRVVIGVYKRATDMRRDFPNIKRLFVR